MCIFADQSLATVSSKPLATARSAIAAVTSPVMSRFALLIWAQTTNIVTFRHPQRDWNFRELLRRVTGYQALPVSNTYSAIPAIPASSSWKRHDATGSNSFSPGAKAPPG